MIKYSAEVLAEDNAGLLRYHIYKLISNARW